MELPAAHGRVEARPRPRRGQLRRAQAGRADAHLHHDAHGADQGRGTSRRDNVVTGYGNEAGAALASSDGIAKLGFTGSTATGTKILQCAAEKLIPTTLELGGKSPNIFFSSVCDKDDEFLDKAVEGAVLFALNQGEVCTCNSRMLVQEDIYDKFMEKVVARTEAIKTGDPLDPATMMGAQVSVAQQDRILNYLSIGEKEGAKVLTGGAKNDCISGGYYIKPCACAALSPRAASLAPRLRRRPQPRPHQDHPLGDQQHEGLPGGDLRAGHGGGHLQNRGRGDRHRQRHHLRPRRGRVDPRRPPDVHGAARHPGGPRLGQLLPRLPGARPVRRLQEVGLRLRDAQDDAGPLPPDQEHAHLARQEQAGLLLKRAQHLRCRHRCVEERSASEHVFHVPCTHSSSADGVPPPRALTDLSTGAGAHRFPPRDTRTLHGTVSLDSIGSLSR
mmetsp:Transcript_4939/g.14452  ORF Transcript_4939/g.14452 Transcript_4939/m.14452 type:complete len:445 (-) Transcript_4939:979-2313(-)